MEDLNERENCSNDFDDMDSFAEECARRLAAEHERIAAESSKEPAQETQSSEDDIPPDLPDDDLADNMPPDLPDDDLEDNLPPDLSDDDLEDDLPPDLTDGEPQITETASAEDESASENYVQEQTDSDDNLSLLMKAETYQHQRHEDERMADEESEPDDKLPTWLRLIFSAVLTVLGAAGIMVLVSGEGFSRLIESLCFIEAALCLLIAVGLNASAMCDRERKRKIMRTALWAIFIFYCLNAADKLFLHSMIENGFALGGIVQHAQNNVNFDIFNGLSKMTGTDILQMMLYVLPYTFCVPVLMKSYRNIVLYFLYMTFTFMAVSTLQIISMSSGVSLAGCLVCLAGAAAVYIIIMLPPVQSGLRRVGLLEWAELEEDDE